jgi:hypothetical protein
MTPPQWPYWRAEGLGDGRTFLSFDSEQASALAAELRRLLSQAPELCGPRVDALHHRLSFDAEWTAMPGAVRPRFF